MYGRRGVHVVATVAYWLVCAMPVVIADTLLARLQWLHVVHALRLVARHELLEERVDRFQTCRSFSACQCDMSCATRHLSMVAVVVVVIHT
jgi:hypothetical protein